MDQALLLEKFLAVQQKANSIGVGVSVNSAQRTINLSGLGPDKEGRSFPTIQDMENFVDGFELGFKHGKG